MKISRGLLATLCLSVVLLAPFSAAELAEKDDDGVFVLGHDTFDETASSSQVVVVYFYTNWCEHCGEFYQKNFTTAMKATSDLENVAFAKINCENAQSLAEKYQIAGYPALIVFRDGTYYPYDSKDKSATAMTKSIKRFASSSWTKPDQYSDHLTEATFESTVKAGDGLMVKYYVRWCGHCRAMGTEYDKAARVVEKLDPPIRMYQIDCEAEKQLCEDHKVDGYPALRFFRNGKLVETYHGERKRDDFVSYLKRKTGPGSKQLTATKERLDEHIQALHKRGQVAIVGFFSQEDSDSHDVFELVADELRDHLEIVHVVSDTLGKSFGVEKPNGIYLSQPPYLRSQHEQEVFVKYNFDDDKDDLKNWLRSTSRPLVGHLQKHNTGRDSIYHDVAVATFYYTVDFGPSMLKATQFWRKRILRIAKDYQQHAANLTFAVQDDEVAAGFLDSVGLGDSAFDVAFAIVSAESKYVYPLAEDWDADSIREHIDGFLAGTLEPHMRSEPIPARNPGPVKICVAKSFKKLYSDMTKDVMIQFYAPWCPHCRDFEPKYLQLARNFRKTDKNIVFLKYNIMDNQLPAEYEGLVTGYPTTYMRRAGDTEKYRYEGANEVEPITEFIKQTREKPRALESESSEEGSEEPAEASDSNSGRASDEL